MKRFFQIASVLLPVIASATPVWTGNFETGNLSQWSAAQAKATDRLQVVSDVVREGRHAVKVTVRQGDKFPGASGNRNELVYMTREAPGTEYYYKWSTLFPEGYPSQNTWQLFTQWHQEGCCGSPPLEFYVVGEEMFLRAGGSEGKVVFNAPLVRGHWNDFVLHVKWSSNPKEGFVELYKDGELVVPKTMVATQFGGERNYLKMGLYRDDSISQVGVVYHDGFAMGTTLEDVMPPPPPAPVEPAPAPQPTPPLAQVPAPLPPTSQAPVPTPGATPPVASPSPGSTLPGDPNGQPGDISAPQGCGASATGGMPVMAAAVALALALLTRRKQALAQARSRKR